MVKKYCRQGQVLTEKKSISFSTHLILLGKNLSNERWNNSRSRACIGPKKGDLVTVLANTVHGSLNGVDTYVTGIFILGRKSLMTLYSEYSFLTLRIFRYKKIESISLGLDSIDSWESVETYIKSKDEYYAIPFSAR